MPLRIATLIRSLIFRRPVRDLPPWSTDGVAKLQSQVEAQLRGRVDADALLTVDEAVYNRALGDGVLHFMALGSCLSQLVHSRCQGVLGRHHTAFRCEIRATIVCVHVTPPALDARQLR